MSRNYTHILGIDPSGNMSEGQGNTGIAVLNIHAQKAELAEVKAVNYKTQFEYWDSIINAISKCVEFTGKDCLFVVIEDYRLDPSRALAQSHSAMETPKLIGAIQYTLDLWGIPYMLQPASAVKTRWSDEIMLRKGVFTIGDGKVKRWYYDGSLTSDHKRDALRHAWHVMTFKKYEGASHV